MNHIKKLKLIVMVVSIFLGLLMPITCISLYPDFNLEEQAVSHFGVHEETQNIFIGSVLLIAIGVYFNNAERVDSIFVPKTSRILKVPLIISMVGLLGIGLFDMYSFMWLHNIAAGFFFLCYAIFVSLVGIMDIKYNLRRGIASLIFSTLMFAATMLIGTYSGLAPFEFTFIGLMILWNIMILPYNRFKKTFSSH